MASNDTGGGGKALRTLLIYLGLGIATFAVAGAWVFAGLKIWGK